MSELINDLTDRIRIARDNEAYAADPERQDWLSAFDARTTAESLEYALESIKGKKAKPPKKSMRKEEAALFETE